MSSSKEDELIDGQNHMILALQDHESRLSRNEDDVDKSKHHLEKIDSELASMISQNTILAECETVNILARHLTTHLMSLQNGIYDLLKNKLSPSLVNLETISNSLSKA